jgi:hypothetical protein
MDMLNVPVMPPLRRIQLFCPASSVALAVYGAQLRPLAKKRRSVISLPQQHGGLSMGTPLVNSATAHVEGLLGRTGPVRVGKAKAGTGPTAHAVRGKKWGPEKADLGCHK